MCLPLWLPTEVRVDNEFQKFTTRDSVASMEQVEQVIAALEGNTESSVVLATPLEPRDLSRFCSALSRCWKVRLLVMRGVQMRKAEVESVMAALEGNTTLQVLDLSFNELGDAGVKTCLIALTLGDGKDGPSGSAQGLLTLLLDNNHLDEHGAGVLALLGLPHNIRTISLRSNQLGDRGALFLSGALPGKSMLAELDLRDNDIGEEGAAELIALIDRGRGSIRIIQLQVREANAYAFWVPQLLGRSLRKHTRCCSA